MSRIERAWQVLDRAAIVAVLAASITIVWRLGSVRASTPEMTADAPPGAVEVADGHLSSDVVRTAPSRGNLNAKIVLVEFSDFECPYCAQYVREAYPQIQRTFVDTGDVRYVYLNTPLERIHRDAVEAAKAVACAGDKGKFPEMRDQLYGNTNALKTADLVRYAENVGLDPSEFQTCLRQNEVSARIQREREEATRFGIEGTPNFLVGIVDADATIKVKARVRGAHQFEVFRNALNRAIQEREPVGWIVRASRLLGLQRSLSPKTVID